MAIRISELYAQPSLDAPFWVSRGIIPKSGIVLMGGEAKIGKTWLCLDLAHNLATGGRLWGTEFEMAAPVGVHYFEQEVGEREFQRRVKLRYNALGEPPPETLFMSSRIKEFFLDTSRGQMKMAKELEQSKAMVAIIDPVGRCIQGDENSNSEVGKLFSHLDELLIEFPGLSFVVIHHFGKPPREDDSIDPLSPYRFRGASKWFDNPDTLITFMRMSDHPGEWRRLKCGFEIRQGEPVEERMKLSILPGGIVKPTVEQMAQVLPTHRALQPGKNKVLWGGSK